MILGSVGLSFTAVGIFDLVVSRKSPHRLAALVA